MSKTILTIDDSASIRQMVAMTLKAAGYQVIEAENGLDGYGKATANPVSAVVVDLNMPVMNGLDFLKKYRQHPRPWGLRSSGRSGDRRVQDLKSKLIASAVGSS